MCIRDSYFHYIFGLAIVILTALIATDLLKDIWVVFAGFVASAAAAANTFLRPDQKAALFRARWHSLNSVLLNPSITDINEVYEAYIKGEALTTASIFKVDQSADEDE